MADQMAADGGLRRLFEKPMPENPTLLEALSAWNHRVHPNKPIDTTSFTEIFGELHFQEKPDRRAVSPQPVPAPPLPPPRTTSWVDADEADKSKDDLSLDALLKPKPASGVKRSASFCMKKSSASSLLLCTEGLGSESTVDADDMLKDGDGDAEAAAALSMEVDSERTAEMDGGAEEGKQEKEKENRPPSFPPPIRSIGLVGKPCVCFRSFRADGRFVLMEVVIPGKELLQPYREGGRLRLRFANAAAAAAGVGGDEEMHGEDKGHAENAFIIAGTESSAMACP